MTKIKAHNLIYGTTEKVALNMRAKILHSELEHATGIKFNTWKNRKIDQELDGEVLAMVNLALAIKHIGKIVKLKWVIPTREHESAFFDACDFYENFRGAGSE